ncbi:lysine--tRNA ligase [Hydrogenimonas urashimensis]|uniref:lysine--tRNA ligase n=1 Tax=Hydrogenimonas urashimensis TaxID=2740515 RepID=UPI0019158F2E|nr:lysine--tRNA ligase [Hydrogenimonas urashimensis]
MIFDNQYQKLRIEKVQKLREMGINPYQNRVVKECTNKEFLEKYAWLKESEEKEALNESCTVTGRIKFLRLMGKAAFAKIEDESGVLQIYFSRDDLGDEWFKTVKKMVEVGDIVAATGYPFITRTGELTLHAKRLELVTKAITPLPEKYHGLQDIELRYRQRYLDLIMNPEVKKTFLMRSKIVSLIRRFFEEHGFLEVETPMMHPIPGGANARPFITHHNALGVDRYLRIAPELYLKRLIVGGFEAVFEINRNFRNEGMDATHNPEFTMIEFYWAYHRYEDLMELTEKLFEYLFKELGLPTKLPYGDLEIDFSTPFRRIAYKEALVKIGGVPEEILDDENAMQRYLKEHGVEVEDHLSKGQLWGELFDAFVEEKLINPTFVTHFPIDISPLARRSDDNPEIADRFELFIAGKEIANGFSELNDPLDQYERFKAQAAQKESDDEAMHMDEDYVKALGYGMPPTAGEGIGIDRLVMLLTNQHTIRDVILFPAMRPLKSQSEEENKEEKEEEK